ncbi:hypothetical protein [Nodularia sphaerocarpa]|uniref:hypothetical protein n=1 Tax=Nodularia sphaerocarpa TaxID=137816 RepID=UPI001EFBB5C0|nr:hypothetical protein [Nodularia sphaerocarpa]MDB9373013.1 hypothetical protein [Nodularia sphaerocarpa CS-585]MDB9377434.1 hypothetical protein [Nodularia sphaerocarpa CS-585A2]ULP73937.1 hypothetical protein BDGGKGIB_03597 [Nodularia sphaerocarpa UHCC 0038]
MNHWLGIALVAYLIGAAIEGVSTVSQLSRSFQELAQDTQEQSSESNTPPRLNSHILITIASVSICGAFCWPCRLLHRSMKGCVSSKKF